MTEIKNFRYLSKNHIKLDIKKEAIPRIDQLAVMPRYLCNKTTEKSQRLEAGRELGTKVDGWQKLSFNPLKERLVNM